MINEHDINAFYESTFGYWVPDEVKLMDKDQTVGEMVSEYNDTVGNKRGSESQTLYDALVAEEYSEWEYSEDDLEELKELADLVYVAYGRAWAKGWDLDEALRRVHKNNMDRMKQPDGTIRRRADGKVIKNPDTPKVDLSDLV